MANNKKSEKGPVVEPGPVTVPEATAPDAAKVAAEVLAKADEAILAKSVPADYTTDISGMPKADPANNRKHVPQDHIPGTKPLDALHFPEFAYDDDRHLVRRISLPNEYHYIWVEGSDIDRFKHNGYRFVLYNGGPGSGIAEQGLSGTYLFHRTLDNHVQRGDVFLMYVPMRRYEEIVRENEERTHNMRNMGHNNFHNISYKYGIRSFHAVDTDARAPKDHTDENKVLYN